MEKINHKDILYYKAENKLVKKDLKNTVLFSNKIVYIYLNLIKKYPNKYEDYQPTYLEFSDLCQEVKDELENN